MDDRLTIITADAIDGLRTLDAASVQTCVTSPPYWGLRDYGTGGQIGLESTPEEYVARLVDVFREVRRVLRDDGTVWLNLGDSYAANRSYQVPDTKHTDVGNNGAMRVPDGLKPKDLVGIPWRVAFALQADGWYLRSDIIWAKPNPMPESVTDRPTKAHEYVFLLTKAARYFYDAKSIKEPDTNRASGNGFVRDERLSYGGRGRESQWVGGQGRNKRTVWTIATQPCAEAHFAVMPQMLAETCIKAGSRLGDVVLDPFGGAGTTALVALEMDRRAVLIEINPEYVEIIRRRTSGAQPRNDVLQGVLL